MSSVIDSLAFPSRLVRRRALFITLVERKLKLRAKRAIMGTAWPIGAPYFLMFLYIFVFKRVFDVPVDRYVAFLMSGLLPWAYLTQALTKTITSLSLEPELIRKAPIPYEFLPLSEAAAFSVFFVATLGIFIVYLAITGQLVLATLPLVVLPIAATIILVMALSLIIALVDVYSHDLQMVLGNILTVWFFLVPIVYPATMTPNSLTFLRTFDPMNLIVSQFRDVLYFGHMEGASHLFKMMLAPLLLFIAALAIFSRFAPSLPKDV
jgi:ABC-type polysaccharide/polyol phosphate export permease